MGSSDSIPLEQPRRCWRICRLKTSNRPDDLLVIMVDPAIPGAPFGFNTDMDVVIVATRLQGDSLFPINTFPLHPVPVYVGRLLVDDIETKTKIEHHEHKLFAWAELYPSEAEARAKLTYAEAQKFGRRI